MPVSSFFGMQTSLRGLLAQQRMLDTTGHNIANASTQGYSRQEATLAASQALPIQVQGSQIATGAHLGTGVDVQGFRRIRDSFLDSQYRAQNTNLSDWHGRAGSLDSAELSLQEPGENGINSQLAKFWNAWSDVSKSPSDLSAKQALVQQSQSLTDSIHASPDFLRPDPRGALPDGRRTADRAGQVHGDPRPGRRVREDRDRARRP